MIIGVSVESNDASFDIHHLQRRTESCGGVVIINIINITDLLRSYLQFRKLQLITNATIISSFKICTSAVHIIFVKKLINYKTH